MLGEASSAASIIDKILDFVTRYKKKKETEEKLVNAIENESSHYLVSLEAASNIAT
jgi:hypothetical protein